MKISHSSQSAYLDTAAKKYVDSTKPTYSLSSEIENQFEYVDNKRTNKVIGYKLWFSCEGIPPFAVKFAQKPELPAYLSIVEFNSLEAIEIRANVYFRADGLKVVK